MDVTVQPYQMLVNSEWFSSESKATYDEINPTTTEVIGKGMSRYTFDDYTDVKHVYIDLTGDARKSWHYTVYGPQ